MAGDSVVRSGVSTVRRKRGQAPQGKAYSWGFKSPSSEPVPIFVGLVLVNGEVVLPISAAVSSCCRGLEGLFNRGNCSTYWACLKNFAAR